MCGVLAIATVIYAVRDYPTDYATVGGGLTRLSECYDPFWISTAVISTLSQRSQDILYFYTVSKSAIKNEYKSSLILNEINIGPINNTSSEQRRYAFNYFGYDNSTYSFEGGYFSYCLSVSTTQPSPCPVQLHLFITGYYGFIVDDIISTATTISDCFEVNDFIEGHCINLTFPSASAYFVAIELAEYVTVEGTVSGELVSLNTTELQPEDCTLGGTVVSCNITISDNTPTSSHEEICIVTETSSLEVWYIFLKSYSKVWNSIAVICVILTIFFFMSVCICLLMCVLYWYQV